MNILGKRILLRAIERADLPALHAWFNDPDLVQGLGDVHFPSSSLQQEQWLERLQHAEHTIRLAVQLLEGRQREAVGPIIGYTGFWDIHWRDRRAEHAVLIGEPGLHGQGYGKETILTCARYAFEEMGLYRLDATILETNPASLGAYQACGFQVEGLLRGHALRNGQRVNRVLVGLLAAEYHAWVKQTRYWEPTEQA